KLQKEYWRIYERQQKDPVTHDVVEEMNRRAWGRPDDGDEDDKERERQWNVQRVMARNEQSRRMSKVVGMSNAEVRMWNVGGMSSAEELLNEAELPNAEPVC